MYSRKVRAFVSQRIVFNDSVQPAIVIVNNDKIHKIIKSSGSNELKTLEKNYPGIVIEDFGSLVIMPGIVDSHVHVNEPGRTEWEGFNTATKAAAASGVTTIADMPLNSIPPTTGVENLKTKAKEAHGKIYVDVAFWGGVIPGNQNELRPLIDAGVVGFKCFLCPSGVDEFPYVNANDVHDALTVLKSTGSVLAFHAECETKDTSAVPKGDPTVYESFLQSRPCVMENRAVEMVCQWCKTFGVRCHIVHLSAASALEMIRDAKKGGAPITAETCYHYLVLSAEEVPQSATEFKCCPPIREKINQDQLWRGLKDGILDMVVSDHSPCVEQLKESGNFLTAWGGISSLQFGLPLLWTAGRLRNMTLMELSMFISARPAKLCGLDNRKGTLCVGMDADFVIWDPESTFKIEEERIFYKNKLTPYKERLLYGKVVATVLRGEYVFKDGQFCNTPMGNLLLNEQLLKNLSKE